MTGAQRSFHLQRFAVILCAIVLLLGTSTASAVVIVHEDFDGYTSFPNQKPAGDPVNFGVPLVSEGADSALWLGARFEAYDNNPISEDIGVQSFGGGGNSTPVGRAGDDAGLVLRIDLTNYTDVELDFDWRTFQAESPDRFVVAWYQGTGEEFQPGGLGGPNGIYDWYADPDLGGGVMDLGGGTGNSWYSNNWTELIRASSHDTFQHENFSLPSGDVLYLAFWMDNGNNDFAKFDNINITGDVLIPEPSSFVIALGGLVAACVLPIRRLRKQSRS